jgi:uncharacterized ParB-like nuclease family protein
MARTVEEIQLNIEEIKIAIASPLQSVKIDDMQKTFKGATELYEALRMLERELLEVETGEKPKKFFSSKRRGFNG